MRDADLTISCAPAEPSPVSVTAGVLFCSPSAANAVACWSAGAGHALCLGGSSAAHVLTRFRVGAFPAAPVAARRAPLRLTLADSATCGFRDGGTGARLAAKPSWVAYYYCSGDRAVFGPPGGTGVDTGQAQWTVFVASSDGSGVVTGARVASAVFVGTAGS